ncbi:MAG: integral rane sensor signal transduction histidine kinase [Gemmatimonadetes bacterium]|nr:integral rane sensor signal transduction histidine kinase [Gemmatimonadota bacterium]
MWSAIPTRVSPLRIRLPTVVAALLAVCTAGVVTASYQVVRSSLTNATAERLHSAGERVVELLAPSIRRVPVDARRVASTPAVARWLATGRSDAAIQTFLDSALHDTPQSVAVVLARKNGDHVVAGDTSQTHAADGAAAVTGPFVARGDTVRYWTSSPLVVGADTAGRFIVVRSMSAANTAATTLIRNLVGKDVSVLIGNADGSQWTDFVAAMPPPIDAALLPKTAGSSTIQTASTIAVVTPLPGTPWIVWVGQSVVTALDPATSLVRRLTLLAAAVVLLGALIAWWTIRHMTAPLDDLMQASEALARGDYQRRVERTTSTDEMGRVAVAFNAMAEKIEAHHHELEVQVWDRTVALEKAIYDLRIAQEENVRQERLAILGQLAGGVGHELRNPLGVMTNALYVLESVIDRPDPMVRDYLGILKGQISLSEKIVSDLLDYARTRAPNSRTISVDTLVRHQVSRLGPLGDVALSYDIPPSLPAVSVDDVQIGQVLFNLLTNAMQSMGDTGSIVCSARQDGNDTVALAVSDSGPGIPPDVARRIFEPLFTTKARGLGLGLTVSRMLAESNGGSLTFESTLGRGTTFTLRLPTAAQ